MSDTKTKDLSDGTELNNSYTGSNSYAPRPTRGFEPCCNGESPVTEAKRAGNGPRSFMAHSGPDVGSGIDRGPFSARTKLTSKP